MKKLLWVLLLASAWGQDLKRPTVDIDSGTTVKCGFGTKASAPPMALAYDSAGQATSAKLTAAGTVTQTFYKSRTFSTWQAPAGAYSDLTLSINSSSVETTTGSVGNMVIQYSIDNGSSWTTVRSSGHGPGWARGTSTIFLSPTQDMTQIKVAACALGEAGGDAPGSTDTITIWDIWTTGTLSGGGGGPVAGGSTAGRRHAPVFIN
jgi:hypothetical protein